MAEGAEAQVTRDAFFDGRLLLSQPLKGHRSGTDAVLLAAAAPRNVEGRVFDAGAGVGAVGLGIALVSPMASITLIENEPACVALARDNVTANDLGDRVTVVACDLLDRDARYAALGGSADLVVTNPPFHPSAGVRLSSDPSRRAAHVFPPGKGLGDWLLACCDGLGAKGTLIVINQTRALPEMLGVLQPRLGGLTAMAVHPRRAEPASRVLLRGTRGSRAAFVIAPPLVLHEGDVFTARAARLHAGDEALHW